ncbi:MAG: hypothetical protein GWM92_18955 [Gemmatimonadetes bacterium]|nr:hypothetical protein [Gemmatimonadota bacterium]NIR80880.1 hypothetical protein [Gemmatimonadota bacterium]NIT89699.1 hypothetical protein [Gemmatimonadota bacterium]NIU33483.1 hypothetical protein [Gemmatimonadota bacterium]NIU37765.1 hypothetical protein [Gemmatimonadota bacterium]
MTPEAGGVGRRERGSKKVSHLLWIPAGGAVAFVAAFVFGDLLRLPVDLYHLIYFGAVLGFLTFYARTTELELRAWIGRRWGWAVALGVVGGVVLARGVLAGPSTPGLSGAALAWAVAWRGLAYGAVDGLILLAFPWVVVWRALGAEERGWSARVGAAALAWTAILFVTTVYHLGYGDFRSPKLVQPNIGSTIGAVPTLVTANPIASPLSHVFLHLTAVIHAPETDLYLPPHRHGGSASSEGGR